MADTNRLARLTELTARGESKLVLVGDQAQLSAIGAGGMFAALQEQVPTAELSEVHRARHAWEREAWAQVREGEADTRARELPGARPPAHLRHPRARPQSGWSATGTALAASTLSERAVMLTDASNVELDRINALAQEHRARAGELGAAPRRARRPALRPRRRRRGDLHRCAPPARTAARGERHARHGQPTPMSDESR